MKLATRMLSFFIAAAMLYLLAPAAWAEGTETELPEEDEPILVADEEGFTEIVNALIREFGREADDYCGISVGFCYTKTNEALFYYGDEWYYTASVFKLPLMMMLANDVLNGENPIGDYAGGPDEVLRECLVNSDNTRAFVTASYYYTWPKVRENEQSFVFGVSVSDYNFIGRKEDIRRLKMNFEEGINTILISPRRWGKTSLVRKVCEVVDRKKVIPVFVDIFKCKTEYEFYNALAEAVLKQTASKAELWMDNARDFIARLSPKVSFSPEPNSEFALSLGISPKTHAPEEILSLAEEIAKKKQKMQLDLLM